MPMNRASLCGTNADGTINEDYCVYCYRDGRFLRDLKLEQLIEINLQYLDDLNARTGRRWTRKQASEYMRESMPKLKRWR